MKPQLITIRIKSMKSIIPLLLCGAALSAFAQPAPVAPSSPALPVPAAPPAPTPPVQPARTTTGVARPVGAPQSSQNIRAFEQAQAKLADTDLALALKGPDIIGYGAGFSRGTGTGRTLIIPTGEMDRKTADSLEEDLAVMSRLLSKAAPRKSDDAELSAMSIPLTTYTPSSGVRNLYLEGYGAVFLLSVRFPLVPPPDKPEQPKAKEATSTDWDKAWKELYGPKGDEDHLRHVYGRQLRTKTEEFDAEKLEELKTSILQALKNATHVRQLGQDESVAVVVTGGDTGRMEMVLATGVAVSQRKTFLMGDAGTATGGSTMVIRVKKPDVDAFAKGDLDLDGFRKKATILVY